MADPPPNAESGRCFASLSQLIFHLHSGLGAAVPHAALAELLTALQHALPAFGPEQQHTIQATFNEALGTDQAPHHPGLQPLWPSPNHQLPLTTPGGLTQTLSPFLLYDTLIVEISSDLHGPCLPATDQPFSPLRQAPVDFEAFGFQPSLGQCFFLYLQAEDHSLATAAAWAKAISGEDLQPAASTTLLGRPIVEFGHGTHVWYVWLDDPHRPIHQEVDGAYQQHLLNLLCCRAKLNYAVRAARQAFFDGLEAYQRIEQRAAELAPGDGTSSRWISGADSLSHPPTADLAPHDEDAQRISQLEEHLRALPRFGLELARCERDLLAHRHTLNTNAFNAAQASRALLRPGDTFQRSLLEEDIPTWLRQMDHDAQVLHSGQRHAEQLISALRAIVALDGQKLQLRLEREEKTRDRHLQTTIFVVGAALSISGLAAATRPRPAAKLLAALAQDRKSTRLNSSHSSVSRMPSSA